MTPSASIAAAAMAAVLAAHPTSRMAHHSRPPAPPATGVVLGPGPHYEAPPSIEPRDRDADHDWDRDRDPHDHWRRFGRYDRAIWQGSIGLGVPIDGSPALAGETRGLRAGPICPVMLHWSDQTHAAVRRNIC